MAAALRSAMDQTAAPPLDPVVEADKTLTAVRISATATSGASGVTIDPALLTSIERQLAHHLGPIAKHLIRDSLKNAKSVEALCDALSSRIERADERVQFLTAALGTARESTASRGSQRSGGAGAAEGASRCSKATGKGAVLAKDSGPADSAPLTETEIERARRALAESVGPIARVLVNRALRKARTNVQLWSLLAANIDSPTERSAFLDRRLRP